MVILLNYIFAIDLVITHGVAIMFYYSFKALKKKQKLYENNLGPTSEAINN